MEERIRITVDLPERARRALYICAARLNLSVGEVIQDLVENHMNDDLVLADKAIAQGTQAGNTKKRRPRKSTES